MKYLRSLNESYQIRDVEDFVRDHLAYLLDDQTFDIKVELSNDESPKRYRIMLYKVGTEATLKYIANGLKRVDVDRFAWFEIKEHFLPFFHFFKKEYSVTSFSFFDKESSYLTVKSTDIDDKFTYNRYIYSVNMEIYADTILDYLKSLDASKELKKLEDNDRFSVWKRKSTAVKWRVYYIFFKNIVAKEGNPCKVLKMNYDTQSSAHYNFNIQYNYFKSIGFNSLDPLLARNNIDFGDFNRAWYHIEEEYNNR
jgi:hypothetical protein